MRGGEGDVAWRLIVSRMTQSAGAVFEDELLGACLGFEVTIAAPGPPLGASIHLVPLPRNLFVSLLNDLGGWRWGWHGSELCLFPYGRSAAVRLNNSYPAGGEGSIRRRFFVLCH